MHGGAVLGIIAEVLLEGTVRLAGEDVDLIPTGRGISGIGYHILWETTELRINITHSPLLWATIWRSLLTS